MTKEVRILQVHLFLSLLWVLREKWYHPQRAEESSLTNQNRSAAVIVASMLYHHLFTSDRSVSHRTSWFVSTITVKESISVKVLRFLDYWSVLANWIARNWPWNASPIGTGKTFEQFSYTSVQEHTKYYHSFLSGRLLGAQKLIAYALNEWLMDIKKNQLPSVMAGVGPMHSIVQLGS